MAATDSVATIPPVTPGERGVRHAIRRRLLKSRRILILRQGSPDLVAALVDYCALAAHPAVAATPLLMGPSHDTDSLPAGLVALPADDSGNDDTLLFPLEYAVNHLGSDAICLLGSGLPHLPVAFLAEAFARLADPTTDIVLGPGDDGGCYLIGLRRPIPGLGTGIDPFAPHALHDLLARVRTLGLSVTQLPRWYVIDLPSGRQRLQRDLSLGTVIAPGTEAALSL